MYTIISENDEIKPGQMYQHDMYGKVKVVKSTGDEVVFKGTEGEHADKEHSVSTNTFGQNARPLGQEGPNDQEDDKVDNKEPSSKDPSTYDVDHKSDGTKTFEKGSTHHDRFMKQGIIKPGQSFKIGETNIEMMDDGNLHFSAGMGPDLSLTPEAVKRILDGEELSKGDGDSLSFDGEYIVFDDGMDEIHFEVPNLPEIRDNQSTNKADQPSDQKDNGTDADNVDTEETLIKKHGEPEDISADKFSDFDMEEYREGDQEFTFKFDGQEVKVQLDYGDIESIEVDGEELDVDDDSRYHFYGGLMYRAMEVMEDGESTNDDFDDSMNDEEETEHLGDLVDQFIDSEDLDPKHRDEVIDGLKVWARDGDGTGLDFEQDDVQDFLDQEGYLDEGKKGMMNRKMIKEAIGFAKKRKVRDFQDAVTKTLHNKVQKLVKEEQKKVGKDFFAESYEGKNMMDALARIVDMDGKGYPALKGGIITLDNGDEMHVDAESAKKLLDFIQLHDEKEQFDVQRKLRKSHHDFMDVCAACAAPMGQV